MRELERNIFIKLSELQKSFCEVSNALDEQTIGKLAAMLDECIASLNTTESSETTSQQPQVTIPEQEHEIVNEPRTTSEPEQMAEPETIVEPSVIGETEFIIETESESGDETEPEIESEIRPEHEFKNESEQKNANNIFDENLSNIFDEDVIDEEEPIVVIEAAQEKPGEDKKNEESASDQAKRRQQTQVKVDEVLSRNVSKDIYKAFTINDKFRFRRELFGNSSAQYNEALDLISEMTSYEQAADYFLNNYGWNPEDESVKGFLKILQHHFGA